MLSECGNVSSSDLRFYHSVFPLCEGVGSSAWSYDIHRRFQLNADHQQEYVLHVREPEKQVYTTY